MPAGLTKVEVISPPSEVNAPPVAIDLAVPVGVSQEYRKASEGSWAKLFITSKIVPESRNLFIMG